MIFTAVNPNKVGIKYEESRFTVMYRGIPLGRASVPGFFQDPHSQRQVDATIAVDRVNLLQADAADLIRDASLNDRVELRILGDVAAKIRLLSFNSPGVQVSVDCAIVISPRKQSLTYKQCGFDGLNKNRTWDRLGIQMPETYVVHLGNSKDLMEVAENNVAKRVLREHIRESLGVRNEDILFAIINSVSRGKGQDLFLRAFHQSLQMIQDKKLRVPRIHAVVVGSDMNAHTKFETELRNFVNENKIQDRVHFVNKTLSVAPYLASIDVLVQNSQGRGECFGRITIEAMAFQLPVLGTAAGGTMEIVVNGTTGLLHPAGKEGVTPLAHNIVKLATHVERRLTMGKKGYERVRQMFLEQHMMQRIAVVLKKVMEKAKSHS